MDSMFSSGDSGSTPQPAVQQTLSEAPSACEAQAKAFTDCMTTNNGDMSVGIPKVTTTQQRYQEVSQYSIPIQPK